MRLVRTLNVVVATALIAAPVVLQAQQDTKQWVVTPRGGITRYAREASLKTSPFVGLDAAYYFTQMFAIGTTLSVGRSNSRGEDFVAALNFGTPTAGDTTQYYGVTQPVTMFDAAVNGTVRMPAGRFSPFLSGGVGVYTMYLNPQVTGSPRRLSNMSLNFGGGLDLQVGRGAGVQIALRDMILTDYDRDFLNPTDARFVEFRFPEDFIAPPEKKGTLHNLQFSVGFSFRPSAAGTNTGSGDNQ